MNLQSGDRLYVRIDVRVGDKQADPVTLQKHFEYVKGMASEMELCGGGFSGSQAEAGMILFRATDIESAHKICTNDPVIVGHYYTYHLFEWEILLASQSRAITTG